MDKIALKYNITIFSEYCNQQNALNIINSALNVRRLIIGSLEMTQNGKEHYHIYLELERKCRFERIKELFPNCHIESVFGTIKENYDYLTKEGQCYYINFNINDFLEKKEKQDEIERQLINDIFIEKYNIKYIILKYPKYAIYNINAIKLLIEIRDMEEIKALDGVKKAIPLKR